MRDWAPGTTPGRWSARGRSCGMRHRRSPGARRCNISPMSDWQPDWYLGQGDDHVPMAFTVTDQHGNYVDLTGATVQLIWGPKSGATPATTAAGSVAGTTPNTQAQYVWLAADTAAAGNFEASYEITLAGGERLSWPFCAWGRRLQVQIGAPPA